jgi:hypothetical protein
MKQFLTPLFILFLLGPIVSAAQNLLVNGSFEQGLTSWQNQASTAEGAVAAFSLETTDIK